VSSFVICRVCHALHWGPLGAAGLLLGDPTGRWVLLQLRSATVHNPSTWGLLGGAREPGESARDAALREAHEEAELPTDAVTVVRELTGIDHDGWTYTYVVGWADLLTPARLSAESAALSWRRTPEVADLPLHPDLARDWPRLREELGWN
jgi:8-oxo-dGTP diphosphatase